MRSFNSDVFKSRRDEFFNKMDDGVAVLIGSKLTYRNEDVAYPFRQNSDFYFLTGFEEPESYAFFIKSGEDQKFVLVVPERDETAEVWTGFRAGITDAIETYKADEAFEIDNPNVFKEKLREYASDKPRIYFPLGFDEKEDKVFIELKKMMYWKGKKGNTFPPIILCPRKLIHEIRMIKSSNDIKILEHAADITKRGFVKAMKESRPGMFEYQVQAMLDYEYRRLGSARDGYEHIVAAGENACVLHYVANKKKIEENELILIDSGAECQYFSADVTRTFPAGTKFTEAQKEIYNLVLKSQEEAIKMSKPGENLEDIHTKVCEIIREGLKELGFFKFSSDAEIEKEKMERRYFMHGTSHWLGMDVHDVGMYKIDGTPIPLAPGMVFTIEPGLYFDPRDKRVPEQYRGIGIRIEDDILITEGGNRNLTYMIPKTVEEIESLLNE